MYIYIYLYVNIYIYIYIVDSLYQRPILNGGLPGAQRIAIEETEQESDSEYLDWYLRDRKWFVNPTEFLYKAYISI